MNKRVILIDDAAWEQVAGKLKGIFNLHGFNVDVYNDADSWAQFLDNTSTLCPADMFVVDVMMPPGKRYAAEETHDGLITGLYIARDIRERFPFVPIILWSGTAIDTVRLLAIHMEKKLTKCIFVKKPISGNKLLALVEGYFTKGKFAASWVRKIWDGIVVTPSIGGLGVDVKKLLGGGSS
jgi:CheY-like chemotaxis protein